MARYLLAAAAALFALAGCMEVERYGGAAPYEAFVDDPIEVVVPPNAPYISKEFAPGNPDISYPGHYGIDFWAKRGTPILAAAPGVVVASYYEPNYGNRVVIDHGTDEGGRRVRTVYLHLQSRGVKPGDKVRRGQEIATMGDTGLLGLLVHLHFEVRRENERGNLKALDPHLLWADGVGRVTCFDARRRLPARPFRITLPVPCKAG
ncbi:Peptidase family M23 [Meinhardsimonia xiamenensis]|jgi:murein DD-endopeptidase MepM/ murein hydrolase activator NlpD|uniref:Peptidase family M23 n=1 Tax=Meinhardsimonia xiamenensis TaxID=990712 RepID=A0A1G9ASC2_9RHOB|nr:M23 family metallopeptidase [Meinhardsimonia xiamenensis]PRX35264.1 peptidase M23-like protein [Meinhardsimonia xiamenensis]SDK30228.1 Peptidase family M23 [Meinhardsimonia xiamenensis]